MMVTIGQKRVKDVMSRDVVTIQAKDTIHEALELMIENRVSALPVLDSRGRCIGMLSVSDLMDFTRELEDDVQELVRNAEVGRSWWLSKISSELGGEHAVDRMTDELATIGPDASVREAAGEMLRHRVHRLPVVEPSGRLLGIVSTMDLLTAVIEGD